MFAPVRIDGRRLIDGFVANPLPVDVADDARAVIALTFVAPMPRRVDGPRRLLAQVTSAMTNNLVQARLDASRGPRLLALVPKLERRVGLFETDAMPWLVQEGRRLAAEALPDIRALLARTDALGDPGFLPPPSVRRDADLGFRENRNHASPQLEAVHELGLLHAAERIGDEVPGARGAALRDDVVGHRFG